VFNSSTLTFSPSTISALASALFFLAWIWWMSLILELIHVYFILISWWLFSISCSNYSISSLSFITVTSWLLNSGIDSYSLCIFD
jgi:hypothetical protein